jgi:hypothetical protein
MKVPVRSGIFTRSGIHNTSFSQIKTAYKAGQFLFCPLFAITMSRNWNNLLPDTPRMNPDIPVPDEL